MEPISAKHLGDLTIRLIIFGRAKEKSSPIALYQYRGVCSHTFLAPYEAHVL